MTTTTELANGKAAKEMSYTPFMGRDPIKLSVGIVQKMLCVPTKSGHRPDEVQAIKYMMLCKARGLNPFEGDAYLLGYDTNDGPQFSLITAHQAFLKRAETHPEYDGMESGVLVLDKDGQLVEREGDFTHDTDTLVGGWASVYFKSRSHAMKKRLKLATFNTGQSRWRKDPAGMIAKCAEADALRSAFPTLLGGMYLADEMESVIGEVVAPRKASRVEASDLTAFAKAAEPDLEAEYVHEAPEVIDAYDEPVTKGQLFDTHDNTGA